VNLHLVTPSQITMHRDHVARRIRLGDLAAKIPAPVVVRPITPMESPIRETGDVIDIQLRRLIRRAEEISADPSLPKPFISIRDVQRVVAAFYGVEMASLISEKRTADVVYPRQIAMYLARRLSNQTYPDIGQRFGRDHTTVLHSIRKVEALRQTYQRVRDEIQIILMKLLERRTLRSAVQWPVDLGVSCMTDVRYQVVKSIARSLGVDPAGIKNSDRLVEDLGADSLARYEVVIEIEHQFKNIDVEDRDIGTLNTVGDAVALIQRLVDEEKRQGEAA
jgi:acyl carrier protein